ncbi:MAG TPA: nucleotide exchange factor GrpE [Verrucomicrobiota bacterium]|nr:nucleotide exchange factor GrpE [Verrucomicrobiota bacterium]
MEENKQNSNVAGEEPEAVTDSNPQTEPKREEQKPPEIKKEDLDHLIQKASKVDEYYDKMLRISADFDNYRKRMARERHNTIQFANESLVDKLLPVLDNLEAALNATNANNITVDSLKTGVTMVLNQLKNILSEAGLEEINAINQPFDPMVHEAISEQETTDVQPGYVVSQIRKGYKFHSKLLRPATVVVAKAPTKHNQNN